MLKQGVAERTAKVGVIGLGYVDLPLVKAFNASGFQVIGFDVDRDKGRTASVRQVLYRNRSLEHHQENDRNWPLPRYGRFRGYRDLGGNPRLRADALE